MKLWLFSFLLLSTSLSWSQDDAKEPTPAASAFNVQSVISPIVADLQPPQIWAGLTKLHLPISSTSDESRTHVRQGFALLHASWDFEAYRHFCEAIQHDDACLMAYVGIALSIASPQHEFLVQRAAAIQRMLDLAEYKVDDEFHFPEPERGYAFSTGVLLTNGISSGLRAFEALSDRYPNDIQAKALYAFLSRGGYDELGLPSPKQTDSIRTTKRLLTDYPDHTSVLHFWLMLHAEAPALRNNISEFLPETEQLIKQAPTLPTAHMLRGHYLFRSGQMEEAKQSFQKAIELYASWQQTQNIPLSDCDGLIKARLYLTVILYTMGDFDTALKQAQLLALLPIDANRPQSAVSRLLLWEAKTLPVKLYLSRGREGDFIKAQDAMPTKSDVLKWLPHSPAPLYYQGLHLYLGVRRALLSGNVASAAHLQKKLSKALQEYQQGREQAAKSAEYSEYLRGYKSLFIHNLELSGLIAGNSAGGANWFESAAERQSPASSLMPPSELYPMELRLAEYYQSRQKPTQAEEALDTAEKRRPGHFSIQAARN